MIKTRLSLALFFCVVVIVISLSCDKKVGKLPPPPSACDSITYNKHIKGIIDTMCVSCHNDSPGSAGGFPLTSYGQVKDKADAGKIKARVLDGIPSPMPPSGSPPLTPLQRDRISCWLSSGVKQ